MIGIYLQSTKLQVFIDEYLITAADLRTIAQGGTPPSVAALAQLKKRCKLVWVAVTPITISSRDGEVCDLNTLQAALSSAGYQPSVLPHVMRNSDNIRAATTVQAVSEYYRDGDDNLVSVRGWPESGSSTVPGERPQCRVIKDEEWSMEAVASAVEQYLVTSSHNRCVVLCSVKYVTELSAALTSPHLLYTGQQQQQGAVERWLEGEGEGVLVTDGLLFRGCEAPAVVWVARSWYGGWGRIATTRAVAALLLITSDENINCDHLYKYFEKF